MMKAMVKMGKQQERVLKYMQDFGSISSLEAFQDLGITRLSAIIHTLRHKKGYVIKADRESCKNRWNEPVWYARYTMVNGYDKNPF